MIYVNEGVNVVVDLIEEINFFVFGLVNVFVYFIVIVSKVSWIWSVSGFFVRK